MGTNATLQAVLQEIGFKWVWNNNFAEYFMGNYIPPVSNASQTYTSDAGYTVSVDLLKERYRGYNARNVTTLPYFSVMEFGGGPPHAYAMQCPPMPSPLPRQQQQQQQQQPSPAQQGPVNIQKCTAPAAGSILLWSAVQTALPGGAVVTMLEAKSESDDDAALCLTAVRGSLAHQTNDELDALPCNATNPAQRWLWKNGTGRISTGMTEAEKAGRNPISNR